MIETMTPIAPSICPMALIISQFIRVDNEMMERILNNKKLLRMALDVGCTASQSYTNGSRLKVTATVGWSCFGTAGTWFVRCQRYSMHSNPEDMDDWCEEHAADALR